VAIAGSALRESRMRTMKLRSIAFATMAVVTVILAVLSISRPELALRALRTVTIVNGVGLMALVVSRRSPRAASVLFVAGLVTLVSFNALTGGGIRSPGVTAYLIFPLMAGVLLGGRAALVTGGMCALLGLTLVVADSRGWLVQTVRYDTVALWMLNSIYMGIALFVVRTATGTIADALTDGRCSGRRGTPRIRNASWWRPSSGSRRRWKRSAPSRRASRMTSITC
jgi:hypothetical protein